MQYEIGMKLKYVPDSKFEEVELVEVVGHRKRGAAKLSNGWVVDEDGIAEGTGRIPGGRVEKI
jgi:hypothetical protein